MDARGTYGCRAPEEDDRLGHGDLKASLAHGVLASVGGVENAR